MNRQIFGVVFQTVYMIEQPEEDLQDLMDSFEDSFVQMCKGRFYWLILHVANEIFVSYQWKELGPGMLLHIKWNCSIW